MNILPKRLLFIKDLDILLYLDRFIHLISNFLGSIGFKFKIQVYRSMYINWYSESQLGKEDQQSAIK